VKTRETVLPVIHILLATYNGERFVRQQWASIEAQQGVETVIHVADDGSSDGTLRVLKQLEHDATGSIRAVHWLRARPRRSATRSFLMLMADAVHRCPDARWFAYCDQDDVWLPGKLDAGRAVLAPFEHDQRPALYGGRTLAVDESDREGGLSPLFVQPPSFRNAIAQNIMGGNTMLMNRAAAELVAASAHLEVVTHDWLTYQLVSGAGGFIHYDPRPFVRYRQHAQNVIGSNLGWRARWERLLRMLRGEYREWNALNLGALEQKASVLTEPNREVLQSFRRAREERNPFSRLSWLRRSGAFRQKPSEQLMLWVACALGRM
jgi:glycosyltransferase involved in cell wall biosynthesis